MSINKEIEALKARAAAINDMELSLHEDARKLLVGRKAKIICEKYNGQPYGTSRKPLKGKILTIAWVLQWNKSLGIGFEESWDGCAIEGVEVL